MSITTLCDKSLNAKCKKAASYQSKAKRPLKWLNSRSCRRSMEICESYGVSNDSGATARRLARLKRGETLDQ